MSGHHYHIMVVVKVAATEVGVSGYEFDTNIPPYGGNCTIHPTIGKQLLLLYVYMFGSTIYKLITI